MMNSVGAERDPYLQAYIQARMKNHVEEVKLQKVLANLEMGRRVKKIMLNLELFEDRKMAHKLKQEASDLDAKRKKAMRKFINSQRTGALAAFASKTEFYSMDTSNRSANVSAHAESRGVNTAPPSSVKRTAIFPVTKGNSRSMSPAHAHSDVHHAPVLPPQEQHQQQHQHQQQPQNIPGVVVHIAPEDMDPKTKNSYGNARKRDRQSSFPRDFHRSSSVHSVPLINDNNNRNLSASVNLNGTEGGAHSDVVRRRSSTVPNLPSPGGVQMAGREADEVKTPATFPMRPTRRLVDTRSVRTFPLLSSSPTRSLPINAGRPKTSCLWQGDPNAIRSVRRERKKPEEMLTLVKNGEEARRMIRDSPSFCSRNCHKPDLLQELGRSYTDIESLLPAIEKARLDMAKREAAERDSPEDTFLEGEEMPGKPLPVSQIQYLALRSMGGVRRNSLIA